MRTDKALRCLRWMLALKLGSIWSNSFERIWKLKFPYLKQFLRYPIRDFKVFLFISPYCINLSGISHSKYQLLIQRLVLFFYPITAQKPWWQRVFQAFSRKGIPRPSSFRSCKQVRKAESLSVPVFFTPFQSKWRIFEFCQIMCLTHSFRCSIQRIHNETGFEKSYLLYCW